LREGKKGRFPTGKKKGEKWDGELPLNLPSENKALPLERKKRYKKLPPKRKGKAPTTTLKKGGKKKRKGDWFNFGKKGGGKGAYTFGWPKKRG